MSKRIIPGFHLTLGITITMLSLLILIPLASVLVYSLRIGPAQFFKVVTDATVVAAFGTSIIFSFIAAVINTVFGVILAWVLVRYEFPGKRILDGLVELPFALPTAVAGITLSKMYSTTGELGAPLAKLGIYVSYTHLGLTVALIFIGIPFVVRAIQPVLEKFNPAYEEAAYILGADRRVTFQRVILPELGPAMLTGFGLAFARGIGEYGSVVFIAGNMPYETEIAPLMIMTKLEQFDYQSAAAIAIVMMSLSLAILLGIHGWQSRQLKKIGGVVGA